MFMTKTLATAAAAFSLLIAGMQGASAAPRGDRFEGRHANAGVVNYRIANQKRRIRRARATGRLNWVEARRARFELSHIRGFRARYLRDGWLDRREARHLDRLLDQNSRRIRRFATNDRAGRGGWRPGRRTLSRLNAF